MSQPLLRLNYVDPAIAKYGKDVEVVYGSDSDAYSFDLNTIAKAATTPRQSNVTRTGSFVRPFICEYKYDRIAILGYSWGGAGAIELSKRLAQRLKTVGDFPNQKIWNAPITVDLLFTIDPVTKPLPNLATFGVTRNDIRNVIRWVSYNQQSDTKSLTILPATGWFPLQFGPRGTTVPADNGAQFVTPGELRSIQGPRFAPDPDAVREILGPGGRPVAGDPLFGHTEITYLPRIKATWLDELDKLIKEPLVTRDYDGPQY